MGRPARRAAKGNYQKHHNLTRELTKQGVGKE